MILYAKIRRMYFRDKLSINEIARRTSLSRNTVKKWLRMPNGSEPAYQRRSVPTKLTPYEAQLKQALIADSYRPKRDRRTDPRLLEELQKTGYDGGYTQLTDYIRAWRKTGTSDGGKQAFVPLKFRWGVAFQFDWSEELLVVGSIYRRLQVAHIKLCASRAFLLVAYPSQSHEMLFDAHSRAGSERAGRRTAIIQTLLGTAKLNGLDPAAWLKDTLEKLPTWPNSRIDELLPFSNMD